MTLASFQRTVAKLIRIHDGVRPDNWRDELTELELTPEELRSIVVLSEHAELNVYGREQADQRWSTVERKLFRTLKVADAERVKELCLHDFDVRFPQQASDPAECRAAYTLAFLSYLQELSPDWLGDDVRASMSDLAALERAEIELAQLVFDELPLVADSIVAHGAFRLVRLAHDVPAWLDACAEADAAQLERPAPERRAVDIVLVRTHTGGVPRLFEVDAQLYAFLQGEIGSASRASLNAEIRDDLQALGLRRA